MFILLFALAAVSIPTAKAQKPLMKSQQQESVPAEVQEYVFSYLEDQGYMTFEEAKLAYGSGELVIQKIEDGSYQLLTPGGLIAILETIE